MRGTPRGAKRDYWPVRRKSLPISVGFGLSSVMLSAFLLIPRLYASKDQDTPNPGFVTEFAAPLDDVLEALQEVLQDGTIHGTLMFEKELTLTGAIAVESTPLFAPWKGPGKVYYKIRNDALAPRHFLRSADQGTIAVRYVVTSVSPERTRLRIDAIFVETAQRAAHPSDGTVESSEYKAIQDHLQAMQHAEQEAADAQRRRESADLARQTFIRQMQVAISSVVYVFHLGHFISVAGNCPSRPLRTNLCQIE